MSEVKQPAGLVFDLDGTLLDTLGSLAEAFNRALTDLGCPTHAPGAYRYIIGDGARVAATRCLPDDRQDETSIANCVESFQMHYQQIWQDAKPYAGINELLRELQVEYGDLPLAVLSNKDEVFTQQCIDHFFPGVFDAVVGFSARVSHKPDPSGGEAVAAAVGRPLDKLWMIGDTRTDMLTAAACNMTGVGVLWGFRDRDELESSGAHHIVSRPDEILDLIRQFAKSGE